MSVGETNGVEVFVYERDMFTKNAAQGIHLLEPSRDEVLIAVDRAVTQGYKKIHIYNR